MDFQNAGFWRLKAPETSIWAPEVAFGPKRAIFLLFFYDFVSRFSIYLAPSGAKYCEKGLAAIGKSFGKGLGRFWKVLRVLERFCACFAHVLRMFCACFGR